MSDIRPIYDESGAVRALVIGGATYTPAQLGDLVRSAAVADALFTRSLHLQAALMQIAEADTADVMRAIARRALGIVE